MIPASPPLSPIGLEGPGTSALEIPRLFPISSEGWIEEQVSSTASSASPSTTTWPYLTTNALGPQKGTSDIPSLETASAVMELRRLSGLTWGQLATLFSVSRRTIHHWVSGGRIHTKNQDHLWKVLDILRQIDRGFADRNRSLLLQVKDGTSIFDLLKNGEYDRAFRMAGPGPGRPKLPRGELSPEEKALRKPLPPDVLAGALQDTVHLPYGKKPKPAIAGKIRKGRKRKKGGEKTRS